jgi:hypothetical protein
LPLPAKLDNREPPDVPTGPLANHHVAGPGGFLLRRIENSRRVQLAVNAFHDNSLRRNPCAFRTAGGTEFANFLSTQSI